jgi:hypothetical protein
MLGKFDSPLFLEHNMQTIEACGPLLWDLPVDTSLSVKVHVRITQDGKTVNGNSKSLRFSPPEDEWMFFMDAHGDLKPGQAFAEARAVDQTGTELVRWDQLVQIEVEVTRKLVKRLIADSQSDGPLVEDGASPPEKEWPRLLERPWPPDDDYDALTEPAAEART